MPINLVEYVVRRGGTAVYGKAYTEMDTTADIQSALEKQVCNMTVDKVEIRLVTTIDAVLLIPAS